MSSTIYNIIKVQSEMYWEYQHSQNIYYTSSSSSVCVNLYQEPLIFSHEICKWLLLITIKYKEQELFFLKDKNFTFLCTCLCSFFPHTHSIYLDILSGIVLGSYCNSTVLSLILTIMNLQMKIDLFTQTYLCVMIFTQWCPLLGKCVTKAKTCA